MDQLRAGLVLAGRYRLVEPVRPASLSTVWRATDEVARREVAVKALATHPAGDQASWARARLALRVIAGLQHPGVAQVHDYVQVTAPGEGTAPCLVRELVPGPTLEERLGEGQLPVTEALRIVAGVAEILAAVHQTGLVHGNLVPANVVLGPEGIRITDAGLWILRDHPAVDVFPSALSYAAPERAAGGPATPATDMYSLGVVFAACLTGIAAGGAGAAAVTDAPGDTAAEDLASLWAACLGASPQNRPSAAHAALMSRRLISAGLGQPSGQPDQADSAVAAAGHQDAAERGTASLTGTASMKGRAALKGAAAQSAAAENPAAAQGGAGAQSAAAAQSATAENPAAAQGGAAENPAAAQGGAAAQSAAAENPAAAQGGAAGPGTVGGPAGPGRAAGPRRLQPGRSHAGRPQAGRPQAGPPRAGRLRAARLRAAHRGGLLAAGGAATGVTVAAIVLFAQFLTPPAPPAVSPAASSGPAQATGTAAPAQPSPSGSPHTDPPAAATSSASPVSLPPSPVTAIGRLWRTIRRGAVDGQIRPDVAVDFENLIQPVRAQLIAGQPAQVGPLVATLRSKLAARAGEGAVTAGAARVISGELTRLADSSQPG